MCRTTLTFFCLGTSTHVRHDGDWQRGQRRVVVDLSYSVSARSSHFARREGCFLFLVVVWYCTVVQPSGVSRGWVSILGIAWNEVPLP